MRETLILIVDETFGCKSYQSYKNTYHEGRNLMKMTTKIPPQHRLDLTQMHALCSFYFENSLLCRSREKKLDTYIIHLRDIMKRSEQA